jgi:hypothetical protein
LANVGKTGMMTPVKRAFNMLIIFPNSIVKIPDLIQERKVLGSSSYNKIPYNLMLINSYIRTILIINELNALNPAVKIRGDK